MCEPVKRSIIGFHCVIMCKIVENHAVEIHRKFDINQNIYISVTYILLWKRGYFGSLGSVNHKISLPNHAMNYIWSENHRKTMSYRKNETHVKHMNYTPIENQKENMNYPSIETHPKHMN